MTVDGRWQFQVRETEIDRYAAGLFLRQTVRINPGERLDQRAFAVVNVARRGHNEAPFRHATSRPNTA